VTDVTNASRTMLMNLKTLQWDEDLCKNFGIPTHMLPKIKSNSEIYGDISSGGLKGIPVAGAIGDQQAATLGQLCVEAGMAKNTYGTGCFMLLNTGTKMIPSNSGLLTTSLYQLGPEADAHYALEGSVAIAGQGVKWLRDQLKLIDSAADIEKFASEVEDSGGVYIVPAFGGLFAPYWNSAALGTVVGMTLHTERAHYCRALLEATCYQTYDILEAMQKDSGIELNTLRVDGGMTMNNLLMQMQSDVTQVTVARPVFVETTILGATICAGLAVGYWKSLEEAVGLISKSVEFTEFKPKMNEETQKEKIMGWKRAVKACLAFAESSNP